MPTIPNSRRYSRLRGLAPDPRIAAIRQAARHCDTAGRARDHVMKGDYKWPENYVTLLDELTLYGVPAEQIIAVGEAMREAALATVYQGTAAPEDTAGEVLAMESIAEGEANRDAAKLIDAPHCPSRKRSLLHSITNHMTWLDRVKRVLLRDLHQAPAR
jgi:hypothetical protein